MRYNLPLLLSSICLHHTRPKSLAMSINNISVVQNCCKYASWKRTLSWEIIEGLKHDCYLTTTVILLDCRMQFSTCVEKPQQRCGSWKIMGSHSPELRMARFTRELLVASPWILERGGRLIDVRVQQTELGTLCCTLCMDKL